MLSGRRVVWEGTTARTHGSSDVEPRAKVWESGKQLMWVLKGQVTTQWLVDLESQWREGLQEKEARRQAARPAGRQACTGKLASEAFARQSAQAKSNG